MYTREKGMSMTSILLLILVGIVFIRALIAVIPAYFGYIEAGVILDALEENTRITSTSRPADVKKIIEERLKSDNVLASQDNLKVEKDGSDFTVTWTYETRRDFMANIDLVLNFEHYVVVNR